MNTGHLSTLTLHRLRYGELQGTALTDARAHLADCTRCSARLSVQEQERAAFVLQPVPDAIQQMAPRSAPWWRDLMPFAYALVAASALFGAVPSLRAETAPEVRDVVRFRGDLPRIEAWVDRGQGRRPLHDDEVLGAGDRVQLAYDPRGANVIAIAGRDSSGEIEVYTTEAPTGEGLVQAPFALTLDGAPGIQELFVVGSERHLDALHVRAAIGAGMPGVRVARLAIRKETTR